MLHPNDLSLTSLERPDFFGKKIAFKFRFLHNSPLWCSGQHSGLSPRFKSPYFHFISLINHSKFPTFPQICTYSGAICLVSCQNFQFWPLKKLLRDSVHQLQTNPYGCIFLSRFLMMCNVIHVLVVIWHIFWRSKSSQAFSDIKPPFIISQYFSISDLVCSLKIVLPRKHNKDCHKFAKKQGFCSLDRSPTTALTTTYQQSQICTVELETLVTLKLILNAKCSLSL